MNIPVDFDINIYRSLHEDLKDFSDEVLIDHYNKYGREEGRYCSLIKNRNDFISIINKNKDILEIGPLDKPILDMSKENIKSLDYFTVEELKETYKNDVNVNLNKIVKVSYVVRDVNIYSDIIKERFDYCISSHNIEHAPCMVSFLNNISSVLKDDGLIFLCIPDYRYCFDRFRNQSTIFEVLNAFYNKIDKPTSISLAESHFYTSHNDPLKYWNKMDEYKNNIYNKVFDENNFLKEKIDMIKNNIDHIINLYNNNKYIDTHCWKLCPINFKYILDVLSTIKLINVKLIRLYPTLRNSHEFYAILQKY